MLFGFPAQETYGSVTAVIGSEACDLDSIVSTLLYGYCVQYEVTRQLVYKKIKQFLHCSMTMTAQW